MSLLSFAEKYRDVITLVYYSASWLLTFIVSVLVALYFKRRDRRDQQIKHWHDFAETIWKEHNELTAKNIRSNISKVKNTFRNIQIYKDINGTDVLRFMMRDPDYQSFKTEELVALREDLDSVYRLLNRCAMSLVFLGAVPEAFRAELGHLVSNLGLLTLPFYKGEERKIILTCLEHFGRVDNEVKRDAEKEGVKDEEIEGNVPYVHLLRFGDPLTGNEFAAATSGSDMFGTSLHTLENRNYGDRNKFKFKPDLSVSCQPGFELRLYNQLEEVHFDLEKEEYQSVFASKLREQTKNLNFIEKICSTDSKELAIAKALHEIRVYIHRLTEGEPLEGREREHINRLMKMLKGVTKIKGDQALVHELCDKFIADLGLLKESCHWYLRDQTFFTKFQQLYREFDSLQELPPSDTPKTFM